MSAKLVRNALLWGLLIVAATMALAQSRPEPGLTEKDVPSSLPAGADSSSTARPAEMPPKAPTVTCSRGSLTIVGENSTLGNILTAVQRCIEVRFDIPADSREERIYIRLGPGPAPAILRSLLESTGDDFVIEPSTSSPMAIRSVVMIARAKTDDQSDTAAGNRSLTTARRAWLEERRMTRTPAPDTDIASDDSGDASTDSQSTADSAVAADTASAPEPVTDGPAPPSSAQPPAAVPTAGGSPETSTNPNAGESSGQLQHQIKDMEQLFQQRQQMVRGSGQPQPAVPSPSPQ